MTASTTTPKMEITTAKRHPNPMKTKELKTKADQIKDIDGMVEMRVGGMGTAVTDGPATLVKNALLWVVRRTGDFSKVAGLAQLLGL